MDLHLIQSREEFGPEERRAELREVWRLNDAVFTDQTHAEGRPTFSEMFRMCKPDRVNCIANSDIYFRRDNIALLTLGEPTPLNAYALSRWDVAPDGSISLWDHMDSQDTWIVYGGPHEVDAPFPMGVPGVDNRLVYELRKAGFNVTNPSKTIKTYHLHLSQFRSYLAEDIGKGRGGAKTMRVGPPYGFCPPTEL